MKIARDPQSKVWVLSSDSAVLYQGRQSPWDHPAILRDARLREAQAREEKLRENDLKRKGPRANGPSRER